MLWWNKELGNNAIIKIWRMNIILAKYNIILKTSISLNENCYKGLMQT